jgi:peptidoglycan/LPS O-acetylase OafA/YrhL
LGGDTGAGISLQAGLQAAPSELTAHRRSLKALTGIRFFAAFYVVVFHTRVGQVLNEHGYHAAGNFFASGYLAVPLFFLLSGFILAYTYEGQIEKAGDHRRFWEARFARIWPVYAVSLIMSSIPSFTFPHPGIALAAIFMVQAWNPFDLGMAGAWNGVCWTLSVEAVFYIVFPWFQTWLEERTSRTQLLTIAGMLLLCVAINSASRSWGYKAVGVWHWIPLPIPHLPEFFTGVGLGNLYLRRLTHKSGAPLTHKPGAGLPGNGLWTYASLLATIALLCLPASRWTGVIVIAFSALLFGLAAEKTLLSRFLSTRAMLLGGGISYSIYLVQLPVKNWVQLITGHMHLNSEALRFLITATVLIGVSLILFKAVEDPARKVLRGLFSRMEAARMAQNHKKSATT